MKIKQLLIAMIGFFPFLQSSLAQTIQGRVMDLKTTKPIANASIILKKLNGDFLSGTSTNENGNFNFKNQDKKSSYTLEISSIGHQKKIIPVIFSKDTMLNIVLTPDILELKEIAITAEKTTTEQLLDKKVINVGKDLLSSGGNALTVLERLPEIQSDVNGNISLRGDKNVNVLVNGKPSPLSVADLLRQIPSGDINKVEIITSPSSKYPASGLTGIINIITHKKSVLGVNANTAAGTNSIGGYDGNASISIGQEKVVYSLGLGYVKNTMENKASEKREHTDPYRSEHVFKFRTDTYSAKGGLDWFINPSNELSLSFNYTGNNHKMFNNGIVSQKNDSVPQNSRSTYNYKNFDFTTNYKHVFSKPENYLKLDLYLSNNESLSKNEFPTNIGVSDNSANNSVAIARIGADYNAKINKTISLEAGLLWERQRLDNIFLSYNDTGIEQINKQFQNIQSTHASYGLIKFNMNRLSIQAGLRGEIFRRNANLITDGNTIKSNFNNFFPSLHIGYKVYEENMLSFGFNRRTSRPTLEQINPNSDQNTRFEMSVGSPDLRSEFSNNFDVNFQVKKDKFSIISGLSYRLKEDIILYTVSVNENGTNVFKPVNAGNSSTLGLDFSFTLKPLKWWDTNLYTNWNYERARQTEVFFFRNFKVNYGFTLQNDLKLSNKTEMGITWQYRGAEKSFVSNLNKIQSFAIAFRRKIMKNNGNITLRVSDIFNTKAYAGEDYGINFVNSYHYKQLTRAAFVSFTYNFKKGQDVHERGMKSINK